MSHNAAVCLSLILGHYALIFWRLLNQQSNAPVLFISPNILFYLSSAIAFIVCNYEFDRQLFKGFSSTTHPKTIKRRNLKFNSEYI